MKKLIVFLFLLSSLQLAHAVEFTVRCVYFLPTDTTEQPGVLARLDSYTKQAQRFYADEMERHGYGRKTFKLELNANNVIILYLVKGRYSSEHYHQHRSGIEAELPTQFTGTNNVTLIFVEGKETIRPGTCGIGWDLVGTRTSRGIALVPADGSCLTSSVIAHELGHTFGLRHNLDDPTYLMGAGNEILAGCEAEWLNVHHYFNTTQTFNDAPEITRIYPPEPIGDDIRYKVDIHDSDGLIQAHFFLSLGIELVGCSTLSAQTDTAEAIVPKWKVTNTDVIQFQAIDTKGNYTLHKIPTTVTVIENEDGATYLSLVNGDQPTPNTFGLNPKNPSQQWTSWKIPIDNRTNNGNKFVISGQVFERGISGVPFHDTPIVFDYDLTGGTYAAFEGYIGLADEHDHAIQAGNLSSCGQGGTAHFTFMIDDRQVYKSNKLTGSDAAIKVAFSIPTDAKILKILVDSAGDWKHCDAAVIGNAKLIHGSGSSVDIITDTIANPDVNRDGDVNVIDLVLVAARYGERIDGNPNPNPDVDRSGKVDVNDLVLVATAIDNANSAYSAPAQPLAPTETALLPNYPNPFNPETWIPYQLSKDSTVTITIYDTQGVIVRRLPIGFQYAGFYTNRSRAAYWDGRNENGESVASGMYFYQLQTDRVSRLGKMLVLK